MKKITITLFTAFLALSLSAQEAFTSDDMVVNVGAGFGWYSYGFGATSFPAISLSLEKGIKELDFGTLSVGGIVGYKRASYAWNTGYDDWRWTDLIVAARGALHVDLFDNEKIDTYGGIALGVRVQSFRGYSSIFLNDSEKITTTTTHPLFALYLGGRYYFSNNFGAFGEVGYGLGYLTLGLSYKF